LLTELPRLDSASALQISVTLVAALVLATFGMTLF